MYVSVCFTFVFVIECTYVHDPVCLWRPEVNLWCLAALPWWLSTLFSETVSLCMMLLLTCPSLQPLYHQIVWGSQLIGDGYITAISIMQGSLCVSFRLFLKFVTVGK